MSTNAGVEVRTERLQVGAGEVRLLRAGSGPPLLFLHAAGGGGWTPFHDGLGASFDVLAPDHPGFDESDTTDEVEGVDDLVYHYLRLLDILEIEKATVVGVSFGGWVAAELAVHSPERVERLVLTNTSSYFADKSAWNDRLKLVREKGIPAFAPANMERWFTKGFRERSPDAVAWLQQMFAATPLEGYIACGEAVRDMDHRELLPKIKAPTLVIAGKHDPATPPEANEYIKNHIPGARLALLDAAHISNVEQAEAYTNAVLGFLRAT